MSRKKITIKDVARQAGVSTATVSYIVNNRTDIKITEETRKKDGRRRPAADGVLFRKIRKKAEGGQGCHDCPRKGHHKTSEKI